MTAALALLPPDTTELEAESNVIVVQAHAIVITDDASYRAAAEFLKATKALKDKITSTFADAKKKAFDAHRAITGLEAEQLQPVTDAEAEAKRRIAAYTTEQERIRREESIRLAAEARRREEDRLMSEAMAAAADGDHEAADAILDEPIAPQPVALRAAVPSRKETGVGFRDVVNFEVTSLAKLIAHCAAHPEDSNLLTPNTTAIRQRANSQKEACNVGGVHVFVTKTPVVGGGRSR